MMCTPEKILAEVWAWVLCGLPFDAKFDAIGFYPLFSSVPAQIRNGVLTRMPITFGGLSAMERDESLLPLQHFCDPPPT